MNTPQYQEIQKAIDFVRKSLGDSKMDLDYSIESVKYLDHILDDAFKNGQLKDPGGAFAKYQGFIMLGISGYLAEVILKNTTNAKLEIDPGDELWYTNFKVISENEWIIQPGQRVIKRAYQGSEAELYAYALSAIKYFNQPKDDTTNENTYIQEVYVRDKPKQESKKPWWKLW